MRPSGVSRTPDAITIGGQGDLVAADVAGGVALALLPAVISAA